MMVRKREREREKESGGKKTTKKNSITNLTNNPFTLIHAYTLALHQEKRKNY